MKILNSMLTLGAVCVALAFPALAETVKVTPLGGIDGEFCPLDRALVFEDPNGTRVLYDPGRTIAGANDPRLSSLSRICRFAVNEEYAPLETTLADGDTVAVLPPMSGG